MGRHGQHGGHERSPVIPDVEDSGSSARSYRYLTQQPVSLRRVAIGVSVGAVLLISLAGLPSLRRTRSSLQATDGFSHRREMTCYRDLYRTFVDLIEPVDPVTGPVTWPTPAEVFARLTPIGHWARAVLVVTDAGRDELQAAGLGDSELCRDLYPGRPVWMPAPPGGQPNWNLMLLDDAGWIVGRVWLPTPRLQVVSVGSDPDTGLAVPLTLEPRYPDWPRVAVFDRPVAGAQSDG